MIVRLACAALLAWLLGFALFCSLLPDPADPRIRTDAIVVVTGGPGRVARGFALLAQGRARRMFVSGVDRRVRPSELAAEYRAPAALVACCVELGHESVDTRTNGDETAAWLKRRGLRSIRLVTTDWHMPRARFELARALPDDTPIVIDAVPSEPGLTVLLTEYNKWLLRRIAAPLGY